MPAALFDMDRTLVRKETASLYVRYVRGIGEATWRDAARVTWWVAQYTLGVIDGPKPWRRARCEALAGTHETVLAARCDDLVPARRRGARVRRRGEPWKSTARGATCSPS
jgi:phosphoserine phosphatase